MKKRIRIDSTILSFAILLTVLLFVFPRFYTVNATLNHVLNFLGMAIILKGVFLRMAARGHKKAHSSKGQGLVTTGLYRYTRNPMYLGSFYLGLGFVLIVWPWWSVPLYVLLFYARFRPQIMEEERTLREKFGRQYETYCQTVPRIFPKMPEVFKMDMREAMDWQEAWSTKERWGLLSWPGMAVFLELLQQKFVLGSADFGRTLLIFLSAILVFLVYALLRYQQNK